MIFPCLGIQDKHTDQGVNHRTNEKDAGVHLKSRVRRRRLLLSQILELVHTVYAFNGTDSCRAR